MVITAKRLAEICREWYFAFRNKGKGEEKCVLELLDAADTIEVLEAAQPKWISVEEGLQKDFVSVLGFMTDAGQFPPVRECYAICDGKAWIFPALAEHHPVSHWMPMPEPPKGDV